MQSEAHKLFLQACANNGCIELKNAQEILTKALEKYNDSEETDQSVDLAKYVKEININIKEMDQKLTIVNDEISNKDFIVFSNTIEDSIHDFQNQFNAAELTYFRLLLKNIVGKNDHTIKIIAAINLVSGVKEKALSKTHAENLIDMWINIGYFTVMDDEFLLLGPRTIIEFGNIIALQFPDQVKYCSQCNIFIFYGIKCGNTSCGRLFHRACIKEHLKHFSDCPSCKEQWITDA